MRRIRLAEDLSRVHGVIQKEKAALVLRSYLFEVAVSGKFGMNLTVTRFARKKRAA
jgi:hypothetical protein